MTIVEGERGLFRFCGEEEYGVVCTYVPCFSIIASNFVTVGAGEKCDKRTVVLGVVIVARV